MTLRRKTVYEPGPLSLYACDVMIDTHGYVDDVELVSRSERVEE
jgi:hypothetical protein